MFTTVKFNPGPGAYETVNMNSKGSYYPAKFKNSFKYVIPPATL